MNGFLSSSCKCWWMWSRRSVSMSRHNGWSKCWPKKKENVNLINCRSCLSWPSCYATRHHTKSHNFGKTSYIMPRGVTLFSNNASRKHAILENLVFLCHTGSGCFRIMWSHGITQFWQNQLLYVTLLLRDVVHEITQFGKTQLLYVTLFLNYVITRTAKLVFLCHKCRTVF